ncbi:MULTISPECIES: PadR family transcriptional regulator [unclassified Vibrio]|uniref:PadR family transcriptional regulator n=1 Tax=unclassified Vibrio TaxID=2614977 RepID=UPI0012691BE9|nr:MULTISPECIES: PadR family transcriptional regulator [unclassified Vibrio]QFT40092.1 Transcriptional regulator PadR-like family protein [Vibrio sp. THAF64]QGM38037.1 Transcriptional regulator PadR-like family protein [Vibrio sp. THAF191d]QGN73504.1 Transcriptional regulator PadR-like family protein [Vibrio sp. THAF191c]
MNHLQVALLQDILLSPKTGYELTKSMKHECVWRASHQQIYRECNRMDKESFLYAEHKPNEGKPDAKIYHVTEQGQEKLNELKNETPYKLETFRHQAVVMQFIGGCEAYFEQGREVLGKEIERLENQIEKAAGTQLAARLTFELNIRKVELEFVISNLEEDEVCAK